MNKSPSSTYKIRFSDCDLFEHLNNARYLDYFLNAREDHLKEAYNIDLNQFLQQDLAWLIKSHNIIYLRPAMYQEIVQIKTSLTNATDELLFVEMVMTDEQETHLKAALWTSFIPINIKTKKRQNHPAAFMEFALSIEKGEVTDWENTTERLSKILTELKSKNLS